MVNKVFYIVTGNTPGLRADAAMLVSALKDEFDCRVIVSRERNLHQIHRRWFLKIRNFFTSNKEIGIFLENIPTPWMGVFKKFVLIPNQEWIRPETKSNMKLCEQIWCKTRYAEMLLKKENFNTRYMGFTSRDCYLKNIEKNYDEFLHVPGRSTLKGTEKVLDVWLRNPGWPKLTVVTKNLNHVKYRCLNISIVTDFLPENVLSELMNSISIHICTSETEGFGHYLNEACSAQSLVVTTDAPPMNELVNCDAGFLIKYESVLQQGISERFVIEAEDFEKSINKIIGLSFSEKINMAELSRVSYEDRDISFRREVNYLAQGL